MGEAPHDRRKPRETSVGRPSRGDDTPLDLIDPIWNTLLRIYGT
jgi:hypothetical protein